MAIPGSSRRAWSAASALWFWSIPSMIIRSRLVTVSRKLTFSPSIGRAVALASDRIVSTSRRSALVSVRMDCASVEGVVGVEIGVVMVGPFEKSGELGATHADEAMHCAKENVSGCASHGPNARLVSGHKHKSMVRETGAEGVTGGAVGPRLANRLPHLGKVKRLSFRCLVRGGGERFGGTGTKTKLCGQPVGKIVAAILAQCVQNGVVMWPIDDGMAEQKFQRPGDLLMPRSVVSIRQDLAGRAIHLGHYNMPMDIRCLGDGAAFAMFNNQGRRNVEAEFGGQRFGCAVKLVAMERQGRGDDEMTKGIGSGETPGIVHRVLQVRDVALNDADSFVIVGVEQVAGQWPGSRFRADADSLDYHQPRPNNA